MLHVIGEILVDTYIIEGKTSIFPGGAPFNVACNAKQYLDDVSFLGVVGDDSNGKFLLDFAKQKGFNNIKVIAGKHTTHAIVSLDNGERSFKFDRVDGTDYKFSIDDVDFSNIKTNDIVHIGSLMLSSNEGINFFNNLITKLRTIKGVKVSFDINYREDIFSSSDEAKKTFIDALKKVDILKFSIEELFLLSSKNDIKEALSSLARPNQIVVITLGKDGSLLYLNNRLHNIESLPFDSIDSTGAGDAFYSYFLSCLIKYPNFIYDDKLIQKYLLRANIVGGLSTLHKGAIDIVPSEKEIDEYINKNGYQLR